ncbi:hypothetical protein CCHL11_05442 [Colletotrichum chlorophyti]|uniref:Uncharacterized protein n=1 Tax=Colletotrichum chlorophyti TaxID=708187 RepID=A0A1Q8RNH8_9PEZI|nr:hypothetical protein CCHL11_05442 [Colletotrichum chlorophyti]
MDILVHDCTDPRCNGHNGVFDKAEISSIKNATSRCKSQTREDLPLEFEKQLKNTKIPPRKPSMLNLARPSKPEEDHAYSSNNHFRNLCEHSERAETAVMRDPAIAKISGQNTKQPNQSTSVQSDRFQELLRKLQRSSRDTPKVSAKERPRQNSEDSGIDVENTIKRTLNPIAKEFLVAPTKQTNLPAVHTETTTKMITDSDPSVSIPLSVLRRILSLVPDDNHKLNWSEAASVSDKVLMHGVPSTQQQITQPVTFAPFMLSPTIYRSLIQNLSSSPVTSTLGLQGGMMASSFGLIPPTSITSVNPSFDDFAPQMAQSTSVPTTTNYVSPPNKTTALHKPSAGLNPQADTFMAAPNFSQQVINGPLSGNGFRPQTNATLNVQSVMPSQGTFNAYAAPTLVPDTEPRPARKPRAPDPVGQQNYEAYIEWRKANEPGYALECKARQAKRALRANTGELYPVPRGSFTHLGQATAR